jgi:hypothetical protein
VPFRKPRPFASRGRLEQIARLHEVGVTDAGTAARLLAAEMSMQILAYYTVMVLAGTTIAAIIGLWLDPISELLSLTVFFTLFFGLLWLAWVVAVRMTEPKDKAQPAAHANQAAE